MNFVLFPHFPSNNKLKPLIPKFHNLKTTITHLNYKGQLRFPTTLAKKNKYQNTKYQNNQNTKTIACKNIQSSPKQRIFTGVCFSPLTASRTHQLRVPLACEREEAYTRNRVYFLTSMGFSFLLNTKNVAQVVDLMVQAYVWVTFVFYWSSWAKVLNFYIYLILILFSLILLYVFLVYNGESEEVG